MLLPTATVFTTGNSQAVRLPKAFRMNTRAMWITKNEVAGEIVFRPKDNDRRRRNIETLLRMIEENPWKGDFIPDRPISASRIPLAEWAEPLGRQKKARKSEELATLLSKDLKYLRNRHLSAMVQSGELAFR